MVTQHNVETSGSPPGPISRGLLGGLMLGDSPLARSPSRPLPFPTPKLACIYCTKDSFTTMEALQLHVQAMHGEHMGSKSLQPDTVLVVLEIIECGLVVSSVSLMVVILYHIRKFHSMWICLKLWILLL